MENRTGVTLKYPQEETKHFKIIRDIDGKYKCVDADKYHYTGKEVEKKIVYGKPNGQRCLAFLEASEYLRENVDGNWELHY